MMPRTVTNYSDYPFGGGDFWCQPCADDRGKPR